MIRYGHWGRPVLVFPSERGRAWDYENNGMVGAVADLVDGGRCKLYCVDSFDEQTWSDDSLPLEERARRHGAYASWIIDRVVPWIGQDSPGAERRGRHRLLDGRLPRPPARPHPCRSLPRRDLPERQLRPRGMERLGRPRRGGVLHQPQRLRRPPARRPPRLAEAAAARRARRRRGPVGDPPDPLAAVGSPPRRAAGREGHPHELDVWGHDSAHDWDWWRKQIAHHLPRFV